MPRKLTPKQAAERYLKEREPNVSKSTLYNHRSLLRQWWQWCDDHGIEYVNDIDGFDVADFRLDRQVEVGEVTLYNQMTVLRTFVRWMQSRNLVQNGLADGMVVSQPEDDSRNGMIDAETADSILNYLDKYEYGTLRHVAFAMLWHTGMRLGALRSIDLDEYHPEDHYVELHHRPESDTPLKNGKDSEREVNLAIWCCDLLDDYINRKRYDVTGKHGRQPLLTTEHGRVSKSNIREHINQITRPCTYKNECPHDREITECEATSRLLAARCPSSIPPHDLRRSSVTYLLDNDHRKELVADRVDMSVKTLDKHYDQRSEAQKREQRRAEFGMNG
ncbi:site-specific integrase [Haloterrigena sp. SYSU A558-1]|uniref:Site-specific integrase n=1 Tax=Haloterrigena gelatinilytica TaxID=2741724 RepID=A0ABX2L7E2_9EURY|nr:site-specific integrase [Haloterrigena gelatinilytica]NUC71651.1 site-specific integrase [Haloterrigena gelatinilytica]